MAIFTGVTFFACNNEKEDEFLKEKTLTKEELLEPITRIITSTMNTDYFTKDSLDFMLQKGVLDFYLDNDNYLAIGFSENNPNIVEWTNIPYNTEIGKIITKKFEKNKFLKFSSFNDKDYDKVSKWAKSEMDKGNIVVISKEKDGTYTALSYTKWEWALINVR